MTPHTRVWLNPASGHSFARERDDVDTLNGFPSVGVPEWVDLDGPHQTYGPYVKWAGGECPVAADTNVRCLFRGRRPYIGQAIWPDLPELAKAAMWMHAPAPGRHDPAMDIIAYQVRVS